MSESVRCFLRCLELDPSGKVSREMYFAAICEHRMNMASKERSDKIDDTQKKLDMFYSTMELLKKNQYYGGVASGAWSSDMASRGSAGRKERKNTSPHATPTDFDLDPNLVVYDDMELKPDPDVELEKKLEEALDASQGGGAVGGACDQVNDSSGGEVKRTRSNFRLKLKPLPPAEEVEPIPSASDQSKSLNAEAIQKRSCVDCCPNHYWRQFPGNRFCCMSCKGQDDEEGIDRNGSRTGCEKGGVACSLERREDELAIYETMEPELNFKDATKESAPAMPPPKKEYPQDYHSLEFLPYNPLPEQVEAAIFPREAGEPLPLYHDPYWPRKRECLELVSQLKINPHMIGFTGTFISPEARGVR